MHRVTFLLRYSRFKRCRVVGTLTTTATTTRRKKITRYWTRRPMYTMINSNGCHFIATLVSLFSLDIFLIYATFRIYIRSLNLNVSIKYAEKNVL